MSKEQWDQLIHLFAEASTLSADERTTFLDLHCKDETLRAELESLLEADNPSERYFNELAGNLVGQALDQIGDMPPDDGLIGYYRIIDKIGSGGMGTVYLAERADNTYNRNVALKILRRGLDTDEILSRFRTERQILARLNHPNITHILNGGVTGDGRPWLAMDFVEGIPITQYCDEKKLTIDERLRLFLQVCDAVQYAHQNLVIHRDLKPSNILVTPEGVVKLLDFGIAKVLGEPDSPAQQALITKAGTQPLTPGFASPEQILNQPIGTESDVYSLGALLHLLLTGQLPFRENGLAAVMDRLSRREDPPSPSRTIGRLRVTEKEELKENTELSTADEESEMHDSAERADKNSAEKKLTVSEIAANRKLDAGRLQRGLKGDLDTILLTALRTEPERRYSTVKSLADDIRRHLNNHPVSARPDGWGYRSGKFIRRHKTGVAVAIFVPLLIITGLYAHSERLEEERDVAKIAAERAELEAEKAREVSDFLTGLFRAADPYEKTPEELTSLELLERGREQLAETAEPNEVSAEMSAVLGNIYFRLGRYQEADELFSRAIGVRYHALGHRDIPTARMLSDYGLVLSDLDRLSEADSVYQISLNIISKTTGERTSEASNVYHNLASLYNGMSRFEEAEEMVHKAIDIRRQIYGDRSAELASSLHQLGVIQNRRSRYEESLESFRETLEIRLELLGDEHPLTITTLGNMAGSQASLGENEEAEQTYMKVLEIRKRIFGEYHPSVATTQYQIGITHWNRSDYAQARHWWEQTLDVRREVLGPNHSSVAQTINALAALSWRALDLEHALEMLTEAEQIYRAIHGDEHQQVALIINNRATTVSELGRLDEAETLYREAMAMRIRLMGEQHDETANTIRSLGRMITLENRWDEAEELMLRALAAFEAIYPDDHAEVVETRDLLERIRVRRDEYLSGIQD